MKKRWIHVNLALLLVTLSVLITGCEGLSSVSTPPASEYPADIIGRVTVAEFMQNITEHSSGILEPKENNVFWVVKIAIKNKSYEIEDPNGRGHWRYLNWGIMARDNYYKPPQILGVTPPPITTIPWTIPKGETAHIIIFFEVPKNLSLSDAQIVYQGQEPYSYGRLTGGEEVVGYDLLSKTVVKASQVGHIATVTNMGVALDMYSYTMPYLLVVVLKPVEAVANQMYTVDLYEKGELRDTATVKWNQPEINVAKEREVVFRSTSIKYEAYLHKDVSHIFSVKVHE